MNKVSVMVIDDEETDRYLLKRILSKSENIGHIFEAENGEEAFEFFQQASESSFRRFPPALIFLDINMPLMNGFEFLEHFSKLRNQNETYKNCIFTMFTSSEREEDKEKVAEYDFVKGFISKGNFNLTMLDTLIDEHILSTYSYT